LIRSSSFAITRRAVSKALSASSLAALTGFLPRLASNASAQSLGDAVVATPSPLGDMVLGRADAPVTLVEYASMSCPHCAAFAVDTFPRLKRDYIDRGQVRFIFREWPHNEYGLAGSVIARCTAGEDTAKFFALVEKLFDRQIDWTGQDVPKSLQNLGRHAGLSEDEFRICFDRRDIQQGIMAGVQQAHQRLNVQAVPTFFINGTRFMGDQSYEELEKVIKPLLGI
jgi:protein-disulfide isomerase